LPAFLLIVAHGLVMAERNASPPVRRAIIGAVTASMLSSWLIRTTPVGTLGVAEWARPSRLAFKVNLDPLVTSLKGAKALIFVREPASSRLMRRMWGIGISRPDAARLMSTRDHCSLLDAVLDEGQRVGSPGDRLSRIERTRRYAPPPGWKLMVEDIAFRTSDRESITPRCRAEILADRAHGAAISYGPALLLNEIGRDGHIAGPIIFVADLAEHNDVLRGRFADRPWYRLELPSETEDRSPKLVPYK
jgi:hypothetical protein